MRGFFSKKQRGENGSSEEASIQITLGDPSGSGHEAARAALRALSALR
jgi:hypothetical protein